MLLVAVPLVRASTSVAASTNEESPSLGLVQMFGMNRTERIDFQALANMPAPENATSSSTPRPS